MPETDAFNKTGVLVRFGNHKLTVPAATVIAAILGAIGAAYRVVASDRAEILEHQAKQDARVYDLERKMENEQATLMAIRADLARVDARVAEVQVTLMRRGNP